MTLRRHLLAFGLCAPFAPFAARAGIVDWFNSAKVGRALPPLDFKYLASSPDPNAKLRLVEFWATWCSSCRESIPKLNSLHETYRSRGLAVVGLTRENEEAVDRFAKTVPMRYAVGLEQGVKLHDLLGIKALPYAIFVDNSNTIVWRGQPEDIDGSLVESLLKKASG